MQIRIEPLEKHHLEDVLCIESTCDSPWSKSDFEGYRKSENHKLYVALFTRMVVGHMAIQIHPEHYQIHNLAVCEATRRHYIGTQLVRYLVDKINNPEIDQACIEVTVRETRDDLIQFFQSLGFMGRQVLRNEYLDEDGYLLQRKCDRVTVGHFIDDELESAE